MDGFTDPLVLEASPAARWVKVDPMESYRPISKKRDPEAGAHLHLHRLAEQRRLFDKSANLFADRHGLLGLFYEYCSDYAAPVDKYWVAPNAMIVNGELRRVNPETEGRTRLEAFLETSLGSSLAMPEELSFYPTSRLEFEVPGASIFGGPPGGRVLTWEDAVAEYGVVALLDEDASRGASIVPTKEHLSSWRLECKDFPRAPYGPEIADGLNDRIAGVQPYTAIGDAGNFSRGWRCRSLLQALYLMVYLDFTGGRKVRHCKRRDCQKPYRLGVQASEYCSKSCTSCATTRRSRNQ